MRSILITTTSALLFGLYGDAAIAEATCVPEGISRGSAGPPTENAKEMLGRLTGHWQGEGFGGRVEEWWSPRDGAEMFGVFRASKDGQTDFFELMKIEFTSDGIRQLVRHLDGSVNPWFYRPVDTIFTLVRTGSDCILFDGVAYRFEGADQIVVTVLLGKEGEQRLAEVRYSRVASQTALEPGT